MKRIIEVEFVMSGSGMYDDGFYRIKGIPFLLTSKMIDEVSSPYNEDEAYKRGHYDGLVETIRAKRGE